MLSESRDAELELDVVSFCTGLRVFERGEQEQHALELLREECGA